MDAPAENDARTRDPLRPLRYLYRVPLVLLHLLLGVLLCALVLSWAPPATLRDGHESLAHRTTRWWSTLLLRIFGFRARRVGTPLDDPVLFVCNHMSWLDIELMHTQRVACFVAKAEIARWPVIGWMAARGGTIFHRRGSNHSLAAVMQVMT
ncbi:MAG TPA: lysophospholipid acyltransferase family protein, partial [Rhodanobacteraceae bacterium]|nr:lysophospholipid acyltransferase family protein [Rhodanobacteraceae bacterium]